MKLAGDLAEFSLADLLQVKSAARQTAGLRILGPEGNGFIVLHEGEVVHAQYEELVGAEAFHALMGVKAGYFEAAKVEGPVVRTVEQPMRELLLDAFRMAEEGRLPRPAHRLAPTLPASEAPQPASPKAARSGSRLGVGLLVFAGLLGAVAIAVMLRPESRAGDPAAPASAAPAGEQVFEASALSAAGDRPPELLSGTPPLAPREGAAVLPTVVCRLRVDARGLVVEAKVYRSRVEFAEFEELAVRAVEGYRFRPGLRAGKAVSAWINLPVEFR